MLSPYDNFIIQKEKETNPYKKLNNFANTNNLLIIWPLSDSNIRLVNNAKFNSATIATPNDLMTSYFKKSCSKTSKKNISDFDLMSSMSFTENEFSHVLLDEYNFYKFSFENQPKLVKNIAYWCNNKSHVIVRLLDDSLFEECSKTNIFLSSEHNEKQIKRGKIQLDDLLISTSFRCSKLNAIYKNVVVKEVIKPSKNSYEKTSTNYEYCLNITPLNKILQMFSANNFQIKKKIYLNKIHPLYDKQYIYIFKKIS